MHELEQDQQEQEQEDEQDKVLGGHPEGCIGSSQRGR